MAHPATNSSVEIQMIASWVPTVLELCGRHGAATRHLIDFRYFSGSAIEKCFIGTFLSSLAGCIRAVSGVLLGGAHLQTIERLAEHLHEYLESAVSGAHAK